jgi:DNA-binding Lrp family transcriptional regulator
LPIGFVLINSLPNQEHNVYNKLAVLPEKIEICPLYGEYDFIIKLDVKNYKDLGDIILNNIKTIKGVIDTKILTGI